MPSSSARVFRRRRKRRRKRSSTTAGGGSRCMTRRSWKSESVRSKMKKEKREALEAAGFRIGDAADFLGLSDEEKLMVELRLLLSRTVKLLREKQRLSQTDL